MDIEYLLLLQNFREATGNVLSPLMNAVSKLAVSPVPIMMACFVYWALDRRAGRRIIGGAAFALFLNGLLKLTFCVYRPWVRDARVLPYGDSKSGATGYSFPSGHSTKATTYFGGIAIWLRRSERRLIGVALWVLAALVIFSRNYLGVHTPQDVVVGFASALFAMWAMCRLEDWTDEDPRRDLYVLIGGLALVVAAAFFYKLKPYPMDYAADGSLIVDPAAMVDDAFTGIGYLGGYAIARFIERRGFAFDRELVGTSRLVTSLVALVPFAGWYYLWLYVMPGVVAKAVRYTIFYLGIPLYAMVVVPAVMAIVVKVQDRK